MVADALGMVEQVCIGEHTLTMTLPLLGDTMGSLEAPSGYPGRPLPPRMVKAFERQWGYRSSDRIYCVTAAAASVLL